jgi:hypothetical protein
MAAETTKFQINFKTADGTLINLYADTSAELEAELGQVEDLAALIISTSKALGGGSAQAILAAGLGATPIATTHAAPVATQDGHCKHGALVWRESKPGAPKEWKGWFCPSPKGTPDQCEPKFVR